MTDETDASERTHQKPPEIDESRFEVKWTKKGSSKPAPASTPETVDDADALRRQLEEAQQRVQELQDRWHRAAADLANLKRRTEQDRGDVERFANMVLVQEILPVLDNFERAITTIPGDLAMLTWIHGVILIERHLQTILERQGLGVIETQGKPFNPHEHEAIAEVVTSEQTPGTVVREYQKGYTMHGRVIRPALVEVAKPPEQEPPAESTGEEQAERIADEAETENVGP